MSVYKDEKHNTWYARFRYRDWRGVTHQTTKRGFKTKREAKDYEAETVRTAAKSPDMTMRALCDKFLADKKVRVRETTYKNQSNNVKKHILPSLGDMSITDISPSVVREWQNSELLKKGLSPTTVIQQCGLLSSIMRYAVKFCGLPSNPCEIAGSVGHREKRLGFWDADQFNQLIASMRERGTKEVYIIAFTLLYSTGMRIGEMLALSIDDFDFDKGTVSITKTMSIDKKIGPPKTKESNRTIAVPQSVLAMIQNHFKKYYEPPSFLFPMSRISIQMTFKKCSMRAGLPLITIHGLRHSHASLLINNGVPITTIAKRLGHTSPKMTLDVYSHMFKKADENAVQMIEKIISSSLCAQNVLKDNKQK